MKKISCNIIKDMLPLYHDNVCSGETRKMVDEHLKECGSCKKELDRMSLDMNIPKKEFEKNKIDSNVIKSMSKLWKRSKFKSFIKGVIISALSISLIVLGYFGLFHWNITTVPTEMVEIKNVSELKDGKIVYDAELTDGYRLNRLKYDMDKEGNFFITPLRPIIKEESQPPYTLEKGYDFIDIKDQEISRNEEIKKIYYGTPKDNILIWEKGMELPKASEEIENMFNFK
ncbi:putative zinc finger protein [Cytobacillus horneckiae]|uniref:Putative zinc-finger domain-containing protein n=1 Tax=Cytobacillus horneckiae TaxID=549687 RepID=A0A2N0ZB81_9BACI|nr:zf-HC2 domain-containing protein [Cytobacillus horneckiae]MBN6886421.1 zf-HC2 domain-containing protein [Cytobacillus horneckiae]MCM3176664.1 zf-HC2 domain-containing protein [Cytobacillus horneckiae]MEC1158501.1 zf-HC2 domain-containing protein [Cytobacillus horneckiae]MED2939604.1 zf-HC2 domain-containing protein [Cytobacillus horneckiae]PKG26781.1 hypothetical protein CWS20_22075 [Cytobacillus horneckiae]